MASPRSIALIGLDIGTTVCKLVVFDAGGQRLAEARETYQLEHPHKDWAELDPEIVFTAVRTTLRHVAPALAHFEAAALAVSAQGEAFVPLDAGGEALMRAPVSVDMRGREAVRTFHEDMCSQRVASITGHTLTPLATFAKLLWMRKTENDFLARTKRLYCLGEYVLHRLGLSPSMDYSMAARTLMFDVNELRWSQHLIEAAGIDGRILPPTVQSGTLIGTFAHGIPELGLDLPISVFAGGHDQACAALGAGVVTAGTGLYSVGTTEALAIATDGPRVDLPLNDIPNYPHVAPDRFIALAGSQNGGRILDWYQRLIGSSAPNEVFAELSDKPSSVLMVPHFSGTGSILDNPEARGAIVGLSLGTTRPEITHAVLEGITFDQAIAFAELENHGLPVQNLTAVGGGARSAKWMQIKADMLGVPITTLQRGDAACSGAAMLAGIGAGVVPSLEEAVAAFVKPARVFEPRAEFAAIYEQKRSIYIAVYKNLHPIWSQWRDLETKISALGER